MNIPEIKYARNASVAAGILFQSKWRVQVLCAMRSGPVRLGQLARLIPGASKKVLTQNLRQLEAEGIITRKDMSDVVLHVEYELHESEKEGIFASWINSRNGVDRTWQNDPTKLLGARPS